MENEHGRTVETAVEARQGYLDRPVPVALLVSLTLILVLYALIFFGFFGA